VAIGNDIGNWRQSDMFFEKDFDDWLLLVLWKI